MVKSVKAVRRIKAAAGAVMESVEARRLMAFAATGTPGILAPNGVAGVDSAAAQPDPTNNVRYATYVTTAGLGFVVPVSGVDSSAPSPALQINSPVNDTVSNTDVASNTSSNTFVVVWQDTHTPIVNGTVGTPDSNILAQVYSNNIAISSVITVNQTIAGNQTNCRVAMDGSGNFTVVWESPLGGITQVYARRFNSTGTPGSGEVQISNGAAYGVEPDVAMNSNGATAIAWATPSGTVSQLFDLNLSLVGAQAAIDGGTFAEPAVAIANNGSYIVAYSATVGGVKNIEIARFNSSGTSLGSPTAAAVDTTVNQNVPELSIDTAGNYAVGWAQATLAAPATFSDAAFRVFHANGIAYGDEQIIAGVKFGADFRFGVALRVPGQLQIAYADQAGEALMQTFVDSGSGTVTPTPPVDAVSISVVTASTIVVTNTSTNIIVTVNGVTTNYSRSTFHSVFISGSTEADFIDMRGYSLPSQVYAGDGNDTIYGGSGVDSIDAGDGDDAVQAGGGDDYVYGGDGTDSIFGGAGNDRLLGGPGRGNLLYGEDGFDTLIAGDRGDIMYGGAAGDSLVGGAGGDFMDGGSSNDILQGGAGNDVLKGGNGNDYLDAGDGNDSVVGGRGMDLCYGGDGQDTLVGGALADTLKGGGGIDYGYFDTLDTLVSVTFRILVK